MAQFVKATEHACRSGRVSPAAGRQATHSDTHTCNQAEPPQQVLSPHSGKGERSRLTRAAQLSLQAAESRTTENQRRQTVEAAAAAEIVKATEPGLPEQQGSRLSLIISTLHSKSHDGLISHPETEKQICD